METHARRIYIYTYTYRVDGSTGVGGVCGRRARPSLFNWFDRSISRFLVPAEPPRLQFPGQLSPFRQTARARSRGIRSIRRRAAEIVDVPYHFLRPSVRGADTSETVYFLLFFLIHFSVPPLLFFQFFLFLGAAYICTFVLCLCVYVLFHLFPSPICSQPSWTPPTPYWKSRRKTIRSSII